MSVPAARAEQARARMLQLFPEGFEEIEKVDGVELVAYTDPGGEERLWHSFGDVVGRNMASGWDENWREFHQPVRVGELWIGPPWHDPPAGSIPVVIDPGRAFGTGAHPTTRICVDLLSELERGSVLDVGCGSGVLAIAAAKLGFDPIIAVDSDQAAVAAATRNAEVNGVRLSAKRVDALSAELPSTDVALANLTRDLVERIAPRLRSPVLVASGYLVTEPVSLPGYHHRERRSETGWAADVYERTE